MKAFLMYENQDFDLKKAPPPHSEDLVRDLELNTLLAAMAGEDRFLLDVAKAAVLCTLTDPEAIVYRQEILRDCLRLPSIVREMYGIAVESVEVERKVWWYGGLRTPGSVLYRPGDDETIRRAPEKAAETRRKPRGIISVARSCASFLNAGERTGR
jgi:hypothetical protein